MANWPEAASCLTRRGRRMPARPPRQKAFRRRPIPGVDIISATALAASRPHLSQREASKDTLRAAHRGDFSKNRRISTGAARVNWRT